MDYISQLCESGAKIYVVGGAVRNYLFNRIHKMEKLIKDYDLLITNMEQPEIISILEKFGKVKEVGQAFGIILFIPNGETDSYEFALPRTEISTGTGYRDFIIKPDPYLSIEEDFSRRDATINAIGIEIYSVSDMFKLNSNDNELDYGQFIDPYNGLIDIKNKIWRAIGDPYKRLLEDPTRIMRAFRQSGELELEIESQTFFAIQEHYNVMQKLIPESYVRIFNELLKLMKVKNSGKFLCQISETGILKFLGFENEIYVNDTLILKLNSSSAIIKFALLLKPENIEHTAKKNIKEWIHTRQILATTNFTQLDLHILIAIQLYTKEIKELFEFEFSINHIIYNLLQIRQKIYKISSKNSTEVLKNVVRYVKIGYDVDVNVEHIFTTYIDLQIMSTDQLVITGDFMEEKFGLKGKAIGDIKNKIINEIFLGKIKNTEEQIISFVEKELDILT